MERLVMFFSLALLGVCNAAEDDPLMSFVCQSCTCAYEKPNLDINCSARSLRTFFEYDQWPEISTHYFNDATYKHNLTKGSLDLSHNLFVNITAIRECPMQVLNLSWNRIERISEGSFEDLEKLQSLDLSHNVLSSSEVNSRTFRGSYEGAYTRNLYIETLNLTYNNIDAIDLNQLKYLPILTELDLSNNPLTRLLVPPEPTEKKLVFKYLKTLDTIPDKFLDPLVALEHLDISDNSLMALPEHFGAIKNLVFLDISHNDIFELDSSYSTAFPRLPKLEELHMCNMPNLRYIGEHAFGGLENLAKLHMSCNPKLHKIDYRAFKKQSVSNYPPIRELYLQSNKISQLDSRLVRWEYLEKVNLSDNPYLCDCTSQWMIDDLTTIVDRTGNSSLMICQEPVNMRGYSLKYLHDNFSPMQLFCANKC